MALFGNPSIRSVLGAIMLTGYLGGAIATHVRVGNPLFSHTLFPFTSRCSSGADFSSATSGFAPSSRCATDCSN